MLSLEPEVNFNAILDSGISLVEENFVSQHSFKLNFHFVNNFVGMEYTKLIK